MFSGTSSRKRPAFLLATIPVVVIAALGQSSSERPKYFCGKGEVISVDEDKSGVTLKHQRIEGFMDAMMMHFKTEDAEVARGTKPGDFVRFVLKDTSEQTRLVYIEKIEPPNRGRPKR